MLAVICGNRGFFVLQTTVGKGHLDSKWQGRCNRGGGRRLRRALLEGIKNSYWAFMRKEGEKGESALNVLSCLSAVQIERELSDNY